MRRLIPVALLLGTVAYLAAPVVAQSLWPASKVIFSDTELLEDKWADGTAGQVLTIPAGGGLAGFEDSTGGGGGSTINVPQDRDGDGQCETIVIGDFDGDLSLTVDDINAGMETLTDTCAAGGVATTGPLSIGLVAGTFTTPADRPPPALPSGFSGVVEIPSNDVDFYGDGARLTTIQGVTQDLGYSGIVNATKDGSCANVTIRDLGVDLLKPLSYDSLAAPWIEFGRMGIHLIDCTDATVIRTYVRNSPHNGILSTGGTRVRFIDNEVDNLGGYGDTNVPPHAGAAGLYFYGTTVANEGDHVDGLMRGNLVTRYRIGAILSVADNTARNVLPLMLNNEFRDIDTVNPLYAILIAGVDAGRIDGVLSLDGGGIETHSSATAWGHFLSSNGVQISNADIRNSPSGGLTFNDYHSGIEVSNSKVIAASGIGIFTQPPGDWSFRDVQVTDTGIGYQAGGALTSQSLAIDNLTFERCGGTACFYAPFGISNQRWSGITVRDPRGRALWLDGIVGNDYLEDVTLVGLEIDAAVEPQNFLGEFAEAAAPACSAALEGKYLITTDASSSSDCTMASGTGVVRNRCQCRTNAWTNWDVNHNTGLYVNGVPAVTSRLVIQGFDCRNWGSDDNGTPRFCMDLSAGTYPNSVLTDLTAARETPITALQGGAGFNAPSLTGLVKGVVSCDWGTSNCDNLGP